MTQPTGHRGDQKHSPGFLVSLRRLTTVAKSVNCFHMSDPAGPCHNYNGRLRHDRLDDRLETRGISAPLRRPHPCFTCSHFCCAERFITLIWITGSEAVSVFRNESHRVDIIPLEEKVNKSLAELEITVSPRVRRPSLLFCSKVITLLC